MAEHNLNLYLTPTYFIDSDHPDVIQYATSVVANTNNKIEAAKKLYLAVRDDFKYDPYNIDIRHEALKSSHLLNRTEKRGYCIEKACLLAATARVIGIPTRLGFANVRNHIGTKKLVERLKTDLMVFHGYTELYLNNKWIKATPAFNIELCKLLNVPALEFNGLEDSILQAFDNRGNTYLEFETDHGQYHDVPHDLFVRELIIHYPHLFTRELMKHYGMDYHLDHYHALIATK